MGNKKVKLDGRALVAARDRLGFTQEKLVEKAQGIRAINTERLDAKAKPAKEAPFSVRTLQRAEAGKPISAGVAMDIAEALEEPLVYLLFDSPNGDDPVIAAFAAADHAIQHQLSRSGNEYGVKELCAVLGLLLARFGSGMARELGDVGYAEAVIEATAKRAVAHIKDYV